MSQHQHYKEQLEAQEEQQKADMGFQQAAQAGMDQAKVTKDASFINEYGDPDVSPDADASPFEKRVKPELSHHHLFGNITREEFRRRQFQNRVLAMRVKAEFPKRSGVSSKCHGSYRQEVFGEARPRRTEEMERKIDSTLGPGSVREQMQSQSIQASAWKGITQMKSVIETAAHKGAEHAGGALGRAKKFLFGGGDS